MNKALLSVFALIFAVAVGLEAFNGAAAQTAAKLAIKTLSARANLVSGGDVLVEVSAPVGTPLDQLTLTLNGKDVTAQLKPDVTSGSLQGVITGLNLGANTLRAAFKGKTKPAPAGLPASLIVTNHSISGPLLSGPHLTPYECRTVESGLGQPLDANCSAKQRIEYFYCSKAGTFQPLLEPRGPRPTDLATTGTYDGVTVPYIVRVDYVDYYVGYYVGYKDKERTGVLETRVSTAGTNSPFCFLRS